MLINIKSLIAEPNKFKLCNSCEKINLFSNDYCVTCGMEISEKQKPLNKFDVAGFTAIIGKDEGETITIEV